MQPQESSFFDRVRRPTSNENHDIQPQRIAEVEDELIEVEADQEMDNDLQLSDELSSMPHEARRVLVYLMRQGTILAAENLKLFDVLCRYETVIRQHLAEVYIQLVLDAKQGVAYIINTENINDGFQYEEAFTVNKDSSGNFDYPFVILSSGREKKFGKNDLIELSRDISTKDDKKHGVVKYMIDSQNICP